MSVKYVSGDLFKTSNLNAYAHGCNCKGAMGKGIALEFKKRWPKMYDEYKLRCKSDLFNLGDVFFWKESGKFIFNLGTQESWRTKASLFAIEESIRKMLVLAGEHKVESIALPQIGAGLGGRSWDSVKTIIERQSLESSIHLIVFEHYVPNQVASI